MALPRPRSSCRTGAPAPRSGRGHGRAGHPAGGRGTRVRDVAHRVREPRRLPAPLSQRRGARRPVRPAAGRRHQPQGHGLPARPHHRGPRVPTRSPGAARPARAGRRRLPDRARLGLARRRAARAGRPDSVSTSWCSMPEAASSRWSTPS